MKCSHGVQFECKCTRCFEEALATIRAYSQTPPPKATPEARAEFFNNCYKRTIAQNHY